MYSKIFCLALAILPVLISCVPSENLNGAARQQRGPPTRSCSNECFPGKGKAFQECGKGSRANSDCEVQVCQLSNLGGNIKAGYRCAPRFIEPSFPPFPPFSPEPRQTFAPVPTLVCPEVCRNSQGLADDDCTSEGFAVAGCRVDSACSVSTNTGFQCGPYSGLTETTTFIPNIDGLELIVQYQWGPGQFDLDSSTEFLGDQVGTACGSTGSFIEFLGDNTSEAGSEGYIVQISDALNSGAWSGSTTVGLFGGWFPGPTPGTITISASLRDASSGVPIANSEISIFVTPNDESSCVANSLGEITITEGTDSFSFEIISQ